VKSRILSAKKEINSENITLMCDFLIGIWNKRKEHRCYNCNTYLGTEAKTYMFDHILEKGNNKYKHLKYEEENICYLCLDCHDRKTRGFLSEKLLKLRELTIQKFFKELTT
jgi:hypothetical protein